MCVWARKVSGELGRALKTMRPHLLPLPTFIIIICRNVSFVHPSSLVVCVLFWTTRAIAERQQCASGSETVLPSETSSTSGGSLPHCPSPHILPLWAVNAMSHK
jgi:hypothetical protein